ncbi:MAG: YcxB family protein, partial [bacterium]|nr:YcxB family protein [bacterium]
IIALGFVATLFPIYLIPAILVSAAFTYYDFKYGKDVFKKRIAGRLTALYAKPENSCHLGLRSAVIEEDGVRYIGNVTDAQVSWSGILKILETEKFLLIYEHSVIASVINKNSIGQGDLQAFKNALAKHKDIITVK